MHRTIRGSTKKSFFPEHSMPHVVARFQKHTTQVFEYVTRQVENVWECCTVIRYAVLSVSPVPHPVFRWWQSCPREIFIVQLFCPWDHSATENFSSSAPGARRKSSHEGFWTVLSYILPNQHGGKAPLSKQVFYSGVLWDKILPLPLEKGELVPPRSRWKLPWNENWYGTTFNRYNIYKYIARTVYPQSGASGALSPKNNNKIPGLVRKPRTVRCIGRVVGEGTFTSVNS